MNTIGWFSDSEMDALRELGWEGRLQRDHAPRPQGVPERFVLPVDERLEPILDDLQEMR